MQYQHEEQLLLARHAQYLSSRNSDGSNDNSANMSMNGGVNGGNMNGSPSSSNIGGFGPDG